LKTLRAFNYARSTPWAITPEALQLILEIASREHLPDFEAVAAKKARHVDQADTMTIREGGVAVIPVVGPIFRYANLFTEISGGTSVSALARDFNTALNDPSVKAITLNVDSPGGEVAGISELAQMVFDGRQKKRIAAYADGMMASAAYWIASAAGEIVADATAIIGSIGIVAAVPNPEKRSARDIEFVSSQSPKKRPNPNTESGKTQIQAMVDDLAEVFVGAVARNRGMSTDMVLQQFGGGGVFVGRKAVAAGLADRLGSFEQTVADLAAGKRARGHRATMTLADLEAENRRLRAQLTGDVCPVPSFNSTRPQLPAAKAVDRQRELLAMTHLGRRVLESERAK
jgi:signal peptide peptidase SppA